MQKSEAVAYSCGSDLSAPGPSPLLWRQDAAQAVGVMVTWPDVLWTEILISLQAGVSWKH